MTQSRIAAAFARALLEDRAALVIYLCAGDPSLAETPDLLVAAAESGADVLEVGVPFSDPTADGPTIQKASERALAAGASVREVLKCIRTTRDRIETPIILFGYYNPILSYGEAELVRDAKEAGVDGFLVVDLPPEAAEPLLTPLAEHGLDFIPLLAPTSTAARVKGAMSVAGSFVYYVSMTGITGTDGADLPTAAVRAKDIGTRYDRPVAVGFGVRTPDDVRAVATHADGVVVGSEVVRAVERGGPEAVRALVRDLAAATRRG